MMNIVKRLKKSNLPSSPKRRCSSGRNDNRNAYIAAGLFASLAGTYLDLLFVGKGLYTFPVRPFPELFSVNLIFTLLILPLFTVLFLFAAQKAAPPIRFMMIFLIGVIGFFIEQYAEKMGWFIHHNHWNHLYSFFGYMFFLIVVWRFYRWMMNLS